MEPTSPSSSSSPSPPEVAGPSSSSSSSLTQPEQRTKLFVGGISSDTQEKDLEEHFRAFGELKQVMVLRDRVTGIGRGFGFVLFAHSEGAETALKNPKHVILRRTVEVKQAIPRDKIHQNQNPNQTRGSTRNSNGDVNNGRNTNSKKIFIGGLPRSITQHELKSYFEKFGSVVDTVVIYDNVTQRPRGFGFITFSSEDSVAMVLQKSFHELDGKPVQVKIGVPKDDTNCTNNRNNNNHHSPRAFGGRGGRPVYVPYQDPFYQSFGGNGYSQYCAATPFPHYPYGQPYGGVYNSGIGYRGHYGNSGSPWNNLSGMVAPVAYTSYVNIGYGSNMFVSTLNYTQDHGSDSDNEIQDGPNVQTGTVGTATET